MAKDLNARIEELENQVQFLLNKIKDLSKDTENKYKSPYTVTGKSLDVSLIRPIGYNSGLCQKFGGGIIWNNTEINIPPLDEEPEEPTKGYHKHTHSRFAGGALIIDALEFVEYDWGELINKHSQTFWREEPEIVKVLNSANESIDKIGKLALVFVPDDELWYTYAVYAPGE